MIGSIKNLLIIPHVKVHNANALSSPFTIGFPAMTAWLGAVHAMQRKLNEKGIQVSFDATGVVSHSMNLQTYRGENDFVSSIVGTGNPLDKTGSRSAFIEEARCHLDVSLLIEYSGIQKEDEEALLLQLNPILQGYMKIAGGDIQTFQPPELLRVEEGNAEDIATLTRKLMPGYALIERRELMIDAMQKQGSDGQTSDAIDALLDYLAVHHHSELDDDGHVTWHSQRRHLDGKPAGWIVPIATGFHGISELGEAKNQRDPVTPHRFAESVVTLGEFKMPYRVHSVDELLWRYHFDEQNNLYLCQQLGQGQNADEANNDSIANLYY
jgi:CRISPR-associated protein Csy2